MVKTIFGIGFRIVSKVYSVNIIFFCPNELMVVSAHSLLLEMGKNLKDNDSSPVDSIGKILWLHL